MKETITKDKNTWTEGMCAGPSKSSNVIVWCVDRIKPYKTQRVTYYQHLIAGGSLTLLLWWDICESLLTVAVWTTHCRIFGNASSRSKILETMVVAKQCILKSHTLLPPPLLLSVLRKYMCFLWEGKSARNSSDTDERVWSSLLSVKTLFLEIWFDKYQLFTDNIFCQKVCSE